MVPTQISCQVFSQWVFSAGFFWPQFQSPTLFVAAAQLCLYRFFARIRTVLVSLRLIYLFFTFLPLNKYFIVLTVSYLNECDNKV